jgi:hypothetical protein
VLGRGNNTILQSIEITMIRMDKLDRSCRLSASSEGMGTRRGRMVSCRTFQGKYSLHPLIIIPKQTGDTTHIINNGLDRLYSFS